MPDWKGVLSSAPVWWETLWGEGGRKSQKYSLFDFIIGQLYWEAMLRFGLVFKWMIAIPLRRSEGKLATGRDEDRSDTVVTTSSGRPKGLEVHQNRNSQSSSAGNIWGQSFLGEFGYKRLLSEQQDSAWQKSIIEIYANEMACQWLLPLSRNAKCLRCVTCNTEVGTHIWCMCLTPWTSSIL